MRFLSDGGELAEIDRSDVIAAFVNTGLVFFEGFQLDQQRFSAFTRRFAATFVTEYNPLERHYLGDGTMTVQYYEEGIPLHGEMAYLPRISPELGPPDILWFYCERPARRGGETTVCDGAAVVGELSEPTQRLLREKRLKYRLVTSPPVWQAASGTCDQAAVRAMLRHVPGVVGCMFDDDGTMRWDYATPAIKPTRFSKVDAFVNSIVCIRPPLEDDSVIPDEVVHEIETVTERLTVPVAWRGSELLMIDNTRYLHGRRSNDDQRRVYVRMGTAGF